MSRADTRSTFVVVNSAQAGYYPYPYVYVNADGGARELRSDEWKYLETPFSPFDGNRPYMKSSFHSKNGWGETMGFMMREMLPDNIDIQPAPIENPSKPMSKEGTVQLLRSKGFEVTQTGGGRISVKKPGQ